MKTQRTQRKETPDISASSALKTPSLQQRRLLALGGAALAVVVVVLLVRGLLTPATPATTPPAGQPTATGAPAAPLVGHYAPDATLTDLNGKPVPISSYRGKVLLLNFWYVACEPCRIEMPALEKTYQQYASKGVVILGVNVADSASDIKDFTGQLGVTYPVVRDVGLKAYNTYAITLMPTSFLIDKAGVIRSLSSGPLERATLAQELDKLLSAG